jgi:hypothetical protein
VSRDDQLLSLLKGIDRKATERHGWYREELVECKTKIEKFIAIADRKLSEMDKRISVNEEIFKSRISEIRREIAITRYGVGIATMFIILVVSVLVSWYAKQPPQDVNPLTLSKEITKLR